MPIGNRKVPRPEPDGFQTPSDRLAMYPLPFARLDSGNVKIRGKQCLFAAGLSSASLLRQLGLALCQRLYRPRRLRCWLAIAVITRTSMGSAFLAPSRCHRVRERHPALPPSVRTGRIRPAHTDPVLAPATAVCRSGCNDSCSTIRRAVPRSPAQSPTHLTAVARAVGPAWCVGACQCALRRCARR
jgi:hypothetical protein